jgi:hypothetical protein
LTLAKTCIKAIRRNRSLLPEAIADLRDCRDAEGPLEDGPDSSPEYQPISHLRHKTSAGHNEEEDGDDALKSDSQGSEDSVPNLNGLSLDTETYFKQYDHDDLDLNTFHDLDTSR